MKVLQITYPTNLDMCNKKNDNIDIFVKLENEKDYCITIATIEWIKNNMPNGYLEPFTPYIIVSELKKEIIEKAIEDFSTDDAYWLRLYSVSYQDEIPE